MSKRLRRLSNGTRRNARLIRRRAQEILRIEGRAIHSLIRRVDVQFVRAVETVRRATGRVVVTGMGKAGIIGQKLSATLSSTGTPSLWVHPAEALHGDLGRIRHDDVVICLSHSGETEELTRLLPLLKRLGTTLIALTGNTRSTLARHSDVVLDASIREEACPLGLAPSASTTAMLAMGDALALAVADAKGFREHDFALLHPGGELGKRLLRVEDVMRRGHANPLVRMQQTVREVLLRITQARAGSACVVDGRGRLAGIFTDGDLRRHLKTTPNLVQLPVGRVMTRTPKTITKDRLAVEALRILKEHKIDELPVVDARHRPIGLVDVQDLLKAGLV